MTVGVPPAQPHSVVERHGRLHRRNCWIEWRGFVAGRPLALWRAEGPYTTSLLLTDGASQGHVAVAQEFMLYTSDVVAWQSTLLRALAAQALAGHWLGWGQVLPLPAEAASHLHRFVGVLLSPPFLEPPAFELLADGDEPVHLTLVTPLSSTRFDFGRRCGGAALEAALARSGHRFHADGSDDVA
jgi:Suppressor of fused protein (SUFU)